MTVMNLDKLEVWISAKVFAPAIDQDIVPCLPDDEKWNLAQQLRGAAQSIPANIAEGHGRHHFLDKVRFCYVARGSLTEVQSHISLARDLGYLPSGVFDRLTESAELLGKQLNAYIACLRWTRPGAELQASRHTIRNEAEAYFLDDDPPAI